MSDYTPPPTITDADTVGKVIRGLENRQVHDLAGLHPATVGQAAATLLRVIEAASYGDQSRIDDAIGPVCRELDRLKREIAR